MYGPRQNKSTHLTWPRVGSLSQCVTSEDKSRPDGEKVGSVSLTRRWGRLVCFAGRLSPVSQFLEQRRTHGPEKVGQARGSAFRVGSFADSSSAKESGGRGEFVSLILILMMKWCWLSSDVGWHIRDKLRPMPKHSSVNLYVHGSRQN